MHRLFVAIRPPDDIRDALLELMGGIAGARWQSDEQLHLTLRFIGEVDRHMVQDLHAALGSIHHPSFEMGVNAVGVFGRRGVPQTLWAGVTPQQPVAALHKKVEQAAARAGFPPDTRAFHPHITLARLGRDAGPVASFIRGGGGFATAPFRVRDFTLYESTLTPEGAIHTPVDTYRLD